MAEQRERTILIAVTSDKSLVLMAGFPQYLRDSGWQVHVVSSDGPGLGELGTVEGVTTHAIAMARRPSPVADLRALYSWITVLRQVRPQITFVGTPKAGLLGGIAASLTRIPRRIYFLRGLRLETSKGTQRRVLAFTERLSMQSAHEVVAVSKSLRQRAIGLRLVESSKIHVLGEGSSNGVDLDLYSAAVVDPLAVSMLGSNLGITPNVPVIGFVGRLNRDKGLAVLAKSREILTNRGIDHQVLIVGGIDEGEDHRLLESVRTAGRRTIETGHVDDPRPYYQLMDFLCLPTLREGFPNVVLEAAALGKPAVTTDATGAIDSVLNGITGRIVRAGDPIALADALQAMLTVPAVDRQAMGSAARQYASAHFSRPAVWERLNTYFQNPDRLGRVS